MSSGRDWYIYYYVTNPATGKLQRVRMKLKRIDPLMRKKVARKIMADIDARLALGWNPLTERAAPKAYHPIGEVMDHFLKVKTRELEEGSMRAYRSMSKFLMEWCGRHGMKGDMSIASFTSQAAREVMMDIEMNDKLSLRSYNNYLTFFVALFNWMVEQQYLPRNPFEGIRKKPKKRLKKNRRMLSDEELHRLIEHLKQENPRYLALCLMCYCCLMRGKEICLLRCRDIDLQRQTIRVSADIAKNDNTSFRTIPDAMLPFLECLDLSHPDWYVFSEHPSFNSGPGPVDGRNVARFWEQRVRKPLGWPMELKFYSLKDTGVTNMLNSGVPISFVQQQADHSSVAMTAIYVSNTAGQARKELKGADIIK